MKKFVAKYFSVVFLFATLMGAMHHHHDGLQHSDCKICTVQSSLFDADTPSDVLYVSSLEIFSEGVIGSLISLHTPKLITNLNANAPPYLS